MPWRMRGTTVLQRFSTNSSTSSKWKCFSFSQMRKISAKIRWQTYRTIFSYLSLNKMNTSGWKPVKLRLKIDLVSYPARAEGLVNSIRMKTKHPDDIMVFGMVTSDSDIMPSFILLHSLKLKLEVLIKSLKEVAVL